MENQPGTKCRRRSRQEISDMLKRYGQSGMSQAEFARNEGISVVGFFPARSARCGCPSAYA